MSGYRESLKRYFRFPTAGFLAVVFFLVSFLLITPIAVYNRYNTDHDIGKLVTLSSLGIEVPPGAVEEAFLYHLQEEDVDEETIRVFIEYKIENDVIVNEEELIQQIQSLTGFKSSLVRFWYLFEAEGFEKAIEFGKSHQVSFQQMGIASYFADRLNHARMYFLRSLELDPLNEKSMHYLLYTVTELGNPDELNELLTQENMRAVAPSDIMMEHYLSKRDYLKMLPHLFHDEISGYRFRPVFVSLVLALGWMIFIIQMGFFTRWSWIGQAFILPAFLFGVFSALTTLAVVVIQNHSLGFSPGDSDNVIRNLAYYVAGVGLREEIIKLVFFLPFAFWLRRERNDLKILAMASLVGLGFAAEENINYYIGFSGTPVVGRFLTANFFHMALTGYCGYYLVRALREGGESWQEFGLQTLKMIFIHGLYDFLLTASFGGGTFLAMSVFIIITREYLNVFLMANAGIRRAVSLPALFVIVLAVTFAMGYFMVSDYMVSFKYSMILVATSSLGVIFIVYMFFYEMRDFIAKS